MQLQRPRADNAQVRSDLQAVRRHGPPTSVEVCQQIAAARVAESKRLGGPLFIDPYAEVMSGPVGTCGGAAAQPGATQCTSTGAPRCLTGCLVA